MGIEDSQMVSLEYGHYVLQAIHDPRAKPSQAERTRSLTDYPAAGKTR